MDELDETYDRLVMLTGEENASADRREPSLISHLLLTARCCSAEVINRRNSAVVDLYARFSARSEKSIENIKDEESEDTEMDAMR